MYRHARIEVRLRRSHFQGDSEPLQHFVGPHPYHVQSHNQFVGPGAHQLHRRFGLFVRVDLPRTVVEVGEFAAVDFDVGGAVFFDGFLFREADGPYWRMGEYDCGYVVVGYLGVLEGGRSEKSIGEATTCCDGCVLFVVE